MACGLRQAGHEPVYLCENDDEALAALQANFPGTPSSKRIAELSPKAIPHPDLVAFGPQVQLPEAARLIGAMRPQAVLAEWPSADLPEVQALGYDLFWEALDARQFGMPQARRRTFLVALRMDVQEYMPFLSYPFPLLDSPRRVLADVLEPAPDPRLMLSQRALDSISKHNAKVRANGYRFGYRVFSPKDVAPCLPARYYKDGYDVIVDAGAGPRRLSVLEFKRIMGFPDDYAVPASRTAAYRLLALATCPPIAAALGVDLAGWMR